MWHIIALWRTRIAPQSGQTYRLSRYPSGKIAAIYSILSRLEERSILQGMNNASVGFSSADLSDVESKCPPTW